MERSACRSLRVHRRHTPNDRDSISRLFTPIRRSMGVLRRRPTCNASSPSPRRAFTKCYSSWSVTDSFAALRDAPELSKCSSLPKTFQCCDERQNSIDHNLCAEVLGLVCPHMAHIRKVNPRDDASDIGTEKNAMKLILRRGARFGPPYDTDPNSERGLLFLAYQTSLDKQFVFLQRNWANALSRPGGIGHDPIIGRTSAAGNKRSGRLLVNGVEHAFDLNEDWVVPTGGCYVFTPALSMLRALLDG